VKQAFALVAWLMAVVLVIATFTAGSTHAQNKPASPDAAITAGVRAAFAGDRALGAVNINVETAGAVVNLSGFVRTLDEVTRAGDLARGVPGVSAVRNGLRVANQPSRA
jgi:osmotically-inducible protein OsmY